MPSNGKPRTAPADGQLAEAIAKALGMLGKSIVMSFIFIYVAIALSIPVALAVWLWRLALGV